jgi:hypothetical protein
MIMSLLLDLANIAGGFLLAVALLRQLPRVGGTLGRFAARGAPFGWVLGVIALVAAGYHLIVHLITGPHLFHFELVGVGVGVALLWDRLTGRPRPKSDRSADEPVPAGPALLLAIFGLIAIIVGIQGLFTPDG